MLDFIFLIFTEVVYRPIYNIVILIYNLTPGPNFGWTMVGLAILIRFIFLVFTLRGFKTDEVIKELEPEVEKIEEDSNLNSKEKRAQIMQMIRSKGLNPYTEIYTLIGQIAFLGINYQIIQYGIHPDGFKNLYTFVSRPESVDTIFYGIDLVKSSFLLSFIAAALLFAEQVWEYADKKNIPTAFTERWFPLLLAFITFILLYILPSAKAVFIATSIIFSLCVRAIVKLAKKT